MYHPRQNLTSPFWIGPYGIYVPDDIDSVIDMDGKNFINKHSFLTTNELSILNEDEYKKKYAVKNTVDQKWYYNRCKHTSIIDDKPHDSIVSYPKLIIELKKEDMHCIII